MADNIVQGLFAPETWEIEQQRMAGLNQAADKYASQDPFARATGQMYRAGGMLASSVAPAFGMVDPAVQAAQQRNAQLASVDFSTAEGVLAAAQQATDPKLKFQLMMLAKKRQADEQAAMFAARKDEREELKVNRDAVWRHEEKMAEIAQRAEAAKQRSEDMAISREDRERARQESMALRREMAKESMEFRREMAESRLSAAGGKPPSGYRYKPDGGLEPIPGGPKDMTTKNKAISDIAEQKSKIVLGKVDEALKEVGLLSTGLIGSIVGMVPGTPAYDLEKTIDTIKANIGFNELQAMRQASPTGGALGQVAVRELEMLQAVISSLDRGQSRQKLVSSLNQVKEHYTNWKKAVDAAAAQEGGAVTKEQPAGGWAIRRKE